MPDKPSPDTMTSRTWQCWQCGKHTDGRGGIDDAMDCFCDRCDVCQELTGDCLCDYDDLYEGDLPS